jgi:hypothetical protein
MIGRNLYLTQKQIENHYTKPITCESLNIPLCDHCGSDVPSPLWNCVSYEIHHTISVKCDFLEWARMHLTTNWIFKPYYMRFTKSVLAARFPQYLERIEKLLVLL